MCISNKQRKIHTSYNYHTCENAGEQAFLISLEIVTSRNADGSINRNTAARRSNQGTGSIFVETLSVA